MKLQYKKYDWPFNDNCQRVIRKNIIGFLNGKGGTIGVGI